jgi:hypothetical protein
VPGPVPEAPVSTVMNESFATAVHVQPAAVLTVIAGAVCASRSSEWLVGLSEYVQPLAWDTVWIWPAIVTVAVRSGPPFAATLRATVPLPVPVAPEVIVSQLCDDVAVQLQPAEAVTVIDVALPPPAGTDCDDGAIVVEHDPAWVTVCVCVPILMVPVRALPLLAATVKVTVPLPVAEAPPVIVIQELDVVAVHAHPPAAETATEDPLPAVAGTDCDVGLIDVAHDPGCVTVKVCPAIVRLPVRTLPVLAVAANVTAPLPVPLVPCVMLSQESVVDAVHAQPGAMLTAIDGPAPPAADTVALDGFSDAAHDPAWFTVKVRPPMVSVPLRGAPVLAETVIVTLPFPDPTPTPATPSHATLLAAVHEHPASTWTLTTVVPPPAPAFTDDVGRT